MTRSDLVVFWGTNAVATQIQSMQAALAARKDNGARIVTVDPYRNKTAALADDHLMLRPGTDAALACAVMHVLFAEDLADRDYMARHTDDPQRLEAHLKSRTPDWAAAITGLEADRIVEFARRYGATQKSFIRLGMGFSRQRNGAAAIHAVSCLPAVSGAWQVEGGGALLSSGGPRPLDLSLNEGLDVPDPGARTLDMSRLGDVLLGDADALGDGPPVKAMLTQNTNPAEVAPDSSKVLEGLSREDLFLCVHEQFPTATTRYADIVLPATTFVEHDDLYTSYGHNFLSQGLKIIEPIGESRCNHQVNSALLKRLGADHPSLDKTAAELVDESLKASGVEGGSVAMAAERWLDDNRPFDEAHFLNGFGHPDGKFRFAPDWKALGPQGAALPELPDQVDLIEAASDALPFRLVTAPARNFLNTSFTETDTCRKGEKRPTALVHPADCDAIGIKEDDPVRLANGRGSVVVHARPFEGVLRGVVIVEGIWPAECFVEGRGINTLVGADPVPPNGGAAFHDTAVSLEKA